MVESPITEVRDYLNRFMVFPESEQSLIVALWIAHTWTFSESFPRHPWTTPYLYVHSAEKQSGKSLLIELCESLVLNPEKAIGVTTSVLFNLIESRHPALFIDEADAIWNGAKNEELRGTINGGYKHGGYIWRMVGGEPTKFSTFCPKLIAGIDNSAMPDTILDRCIPIKLRRKRAEDKRETFYSYLAEPDAEVLAARIGDWVSSNGERIISYLPKPLDGISPRAFEIAMPLIQIARAAGIEKDATDAIRKLLAPTPEKDSPGVALLRGIRAAFEKSGQDRMFTEDIVRHLNETLGEGWSGKLIGARLKPYEIPAPVPMTIKRKTLRGYHKHNFTDAWERYL